MSLALSKKDYPYKHWEYLSLDLGDRLRIVPERGGLITEWRCKGKEVLYFDQERFLKKDKSVRGGIPVLFPICGDLPDDSLLLPKAKNRLHQHGFARDSSWQIRLLEDNLGVGLKFFDNDFTRASYPYSFRVEIEARLQEGRLKLYITIQNRGKTLMPFCFGLHPYFNISNLHTTLIKGLNPKCINQLNMEEENTEEQIQKLSQGVDFISGPSEIVKIIDSSNSNLIELEHHYPMNLTVVWTDPPRSMICVEPWTSPRQSLITGERKLEIEPGGCLNLSTSISYR